jgi:iron-sulfur cluster assembly accessory protein
MSEDFVFTDEAAKQVKKMASQKDKLPYLRLKIDGGGCSGFQYTMDLDENIDQHDFVFENGTKRS